MPRSQYHPAFAVRFGSAALALTLGLGLVACTGGSTPTFPSAGASETATATPSATESVTPTPTPTPTETEPPEPEPTPTLEPSPVPEISGSARYRSVVSVDEPDWGPGRVELEYRWLRDGKPISGASELSYRLAAADIGHKISLRISGYKAGFEESAQETAAIGPVEPGKLVTQTPVISGTARVGRTLTGSVDPWGPGEVTLKWQWYRGADKIVDATGKTYQLAPSDLGKIIKLRVRGYADNYTTVSSYSEPTGKIAAGVLDPTPTPLYSGTAKVGHTITALPKEWGPGTVKLAYQWYRGKDKIAGATKVDYKLSATDAGKKLRVRVRGTKDGYDTVYRYSGYTSEIEPGDLTAVTPVVSGVAAVGQILTVDPGNWGPGDVELTVRWLADGQVLPRAAGNSLALSQLEGGKVIQARVFGHKAGYADRIVDSVATEPVAFRSPR